MIDKQNRPTYDDWKSDIDEWADMWDEMQENEVHPPAAPQADIAVWDSEETNDSDIYYSYVDDLAARERAGTAHNQPYQHQVQRDEEALLQEQSDFRTPNPVYPNSVGPDHENTPPVWSSEQILSEIKNLKDRIFQLENNLAALGQKKQWEQKIVTRTTPTPISKELERLRGEIERVSSQLGVEHEPSPYVVRRD